MCRRSLAEEIEIKEWKVITYLLPRPFPLTLIRHEKGGGKGLRGGGIRRDRSVGK